MAFDEDDDDLPRRRRRRFEDGEDEYDFGKREPPHSGLGIASLVLAVLAVVLLMVLFVIASVTAGNDMDGLDENSPEAMALGVAALGACALALLGLGLGIGGLIQPGRNKAPTIAGVVANALLLIGTAGLICAGVLMG